MHSNVSSCAASPKIVLCSPKNSLAPKIVAGYVPWNDTSTRTAKVITGRWCQRQSERVSGRMFKTDKRQTTRTNTVHTQYKCY